MYAMTNVCWDACGNNDSSTNDNSVDNDDKQSTYTALKRSKDEETDERL